MGGGSGFQGMTTTPPPTGKPGGVGPTPIQSGGKPGGQSPWAMPGTPTPTAPTGQPTAPYQSGGAGQPWGSWYKGDKPYVNPTLAGLHGIGRGEIRRPPSIRSEYANQARPEQQHTGTQAEPPATESSF